MTYGKEYKQQELEKGTNGDAAAKAAAVKHLAVHDEDMDNLDKDDVSN